jgi:hypothetical protein
VFINLRAVAVQVDGPHTEIDVVVIEVVDEHLRVGGCSDEERRAQSNDENWVNRWDRSGHSPDLPCGCTGFEARSEFSIGRATIRGGSTTYRD